MNTIPLDSPNAFDCVACDILTEFTDSFSIANGCISSVNADGWKVFSSKGTRLYERYAERLRAYGEKLFPGCGPDLEIKSWNVRDDVFEDDY